jgi:hypothetical protein
MSDPQPSKTSPKRLVRFLRQAAFEVMAIVVLSAAWMFIDIPVSVYRKRKVITGTSAQRRHGQKTISNCTGIGALAGLLFQSMMAVRTVMLDGWPGLGEILVTCVVTFYVVGASAILGCVIGVVINTLGLISRKF